jgi:hypothetical protein
MSDAKIAAEAAVQTSRVPLMVVLLAAALSAGSAIGVFEAKKYPFVKTPDPKVATQSQAGPRSSEKTPEELAQIALDAKYTLGNRMALFGGLAGVLTAVYGLGVGFSVRPIGARPIVGFLAGLIIGAAGGAGAGFLGDWSTSRVEGWLHEPPDQDSIKCALVLHALTWAAFGAAVGLGAFLSTYSCGRIAKATIAGALGGALGGVGYWFATAMWIAPSQSSMAVVPDELRAQLAWAVVPVALIAFLTYSVAGTTKVKAA